MQRDRQTGVGRGLPDRVVDGVVERPPVDRRVRAHEHRHHARQLGHPPDLGRHPRPRRRARASAAPRRRRTADPRPSWTWSEHQSLYARACASAKSTSRLALQPEQHRRVQHRQVDAGPGPCPGAAPWRSRPPGASRCSASRRGRRGPGPRRSHPRRRPPTWCWPVTGGCRRRATPRPPRRSRRARSGRGTGPARTPASRSGARGCGRRSRCSAVPRRSPSPFLSLVEPGPCPAPMLARVPRNRNVAAAVGAPGARVRTPARVTAEWSPSDRGSLVRSS